MRAARTKVRASNIANYAVFAATTILVLIAARAKSAQLSDGSIGGAASIATPVTVGAQLSATTTMRPVDPDEQALGQLGEAADRNHRHQQQPQQHHHFQRKQRNEQPHNEAADGRHQHHHHHQHNQHQRHHNQHHHPHQHQRHRKQHQRNREQQHNSLLLDDNGGDGGLKQVAPHPYHSKFTIEQLLTMKFERQLPDDIDMDPCKAGGFMGDIALPADAEGLAHAPHNRQQPAPVLLQADDAAAALPLSIVLPVPAKAGNKFNMSFQQELELLKQEVYLEGLQVEEEGLTDIIRKKTKLPSSHDEHHALQHSRNDPTRFINEPVKPTNQLPAAPDATTRRNLKNEVIGLSLWRQNSVFPTAAEVDLFDSHSSLPGGGREKQKPIHGVVDTFGMQWARKASGQETSTTNPRDMEHSTKAVTGLSNRNVDQRRIQSNTKDIEVDSGNNFIADRKVIILPTALPAQRSTLPNVFSNAGGNGAQVADIDILHTDRSTRRRYRRRQKSRRSSELSADHEVKLKQLKEELNRPVRQFEERRPTPEVRASQPRALNYSSSHLDELDVLTKRKATMDAITAEVQTSLEDELLDPEHFGHLERHHRMTRAVTAKKERIWDYGVIPYEIDGNFSGLHKTLFKQAMRHWENFTCIKFVERDPEIHPNYIVFTVRSCGCCSFVGKRGNGPQAISIGRNCDKFGIVVHELGHVVGFWHEHTRPDREKHVVIEHNNILKGQDYNFNKLTPEEVDSLGMAYDYDSIMHYARNTFSKGTYLDTILPIEVKGKKRPEIGQRLRLSAGDIAQANLLYKCPKCGRTFQDNAGNFTSPSYAIEGRVSNETEQCEWRITATHGERIVLRLENLDLFKSNNCQTDYLEVRDGYYFKSPLIGRFCGKVSGEILTTESSRMLLTFVNTHRGDGYRGFKAEYDVICGGELSVDDAEGRLESPNYPLEYLVNKECVWKITVPRGYQVALKFQSFEVENHDSCVYDYVEVRDGLTQDSPIIGVFCGYKAPPNMKSTENGMFVKFVSDTSVQKAGFSAVFMKEVDECKTQNHGCQHECINTLGGYECSCHIGYELHSDKKQCEEACGGVIEYPNGTITSPSFPEKYPLLKECIWEIIAPPKHKISLNFTHFDLEGVTHQQTDCGYDSVTIYSKLAENRLKRIGTYCGSHIPPTATSEGNALRVEFRSDKSIQMSGFAAVFFTDIDECSVNNGGCQHECRNTIGSYMCSCHNGYSLHENGHDCKEGECKHEISAPFGNIYSPNFPDSYPPNADCVWHFSTTPGHRIKLIFNEFNVESHQECAYDNVAIYDGESETSSILGRFCGDKIPYPISSSTNQLYMVLKTDKNKELNGFAATHSTSCGGYLRATRQLQQFYSHSRFGNMDYDDNMYCEWTIQAPMSSNVQLFFLTFDIESSENCTYDFVQVFSGMEDTSGPMYGQFCGNVLPQDIISLTDSLLVRFRTDSSEHAKGFSASYVAVDPFENSEDDENNSYSSELVTPFPGSLKSIYKEDETQESDDYSDFSGNHLINSPYRARSYYGPRY